MSTELTGNVLVAQSGGPTAVINASLAGVITEALNHENIEEIYGSLNGVLGILNESFIDLAAESQQAIRGLRYTPGSALGTCRYKLKNTHDFDRILEVFEAHNIRYFFYIGGNDSQDTAKQISKLAQEKGYELRVIGIPKTIDNDLAITDHCPGYGSVIKYLATTIREMALDHEAMGQHDFVSIVEVMGRNAGWIAAGTTLAKYRENPNDAPHLIYLPEVAFSEEKFLQDVQTVLKRNKHCTVVVSEGIVDLDGNFVGASASNTVDAFGHKLLSGAGEYLRDFVENNLGAKARACKLGISQRAAAHCSSKTDNAEAFLCGQAAVTAAIKGETDKMVTLFRGESDAYKCETGLVDLEAVANHVKTFPETWIQEDGTSITHQFVKYALPLVQGEVEVPHENGLPDYVRLKNSSVSKKLGSYASV